MKKKGIILGVLLAAVAITGYSVSGTYAKYVSSTVISDNARVAKWGIGTPTEIKLFKDSYLASNATVAGETDVATTEKDADGKLINVVAPGTSGIYAFTLGVGTNDAPEVNYTLSVENITADTTVDGKTIKATQDTIGRIEYYLMPVDAADIDEDTTFEDIFTTDANGAVNASGAVKADNINDLVAKLDAKYMLTDGTTRKVYAANASDESVYAIGWRWVIGEDDASIQADTALGNSKDADGNWDLDSVVLSIKVIAEQTELAAN